MIYQIIALICAGHIWGWWVGFLVFAGFGMVRFFGSAGSLFKNIVAYAEKNKK